MAERPAAECYGPTRTGEGLERMDAVLALACPTCGPASGLGLPSGPLRARECARCGGRLFAGDALDAEALASARPVAGPAGGACPSCDGPLSTRALDARAPFAPSLEGRALACCPGCDLWWISGAPRGPAPDESFRRPRRGWRIAAAALTVAVAAVVAAWTLVLTRSAPLDTAPAAPAPLALAVPLPSPPAVRGDPTPVIPAVPDVPDAPDAPEPRPAIPAERLFAGRAVSWWEQRLRQLAARTDPEGRALLDATRRRAERLGLEVVEEEGAFRLVAGEELARTLREDSTPTVKP